MDATSSGDLIADRRFLYAEDALSTGDFIAARDLYEQTLERVPEWLPARFGLARALHSLDLHEDAQAQFRAILERDATDLFGARAWLARLDHGTPDANALSTAYVARLFDDYAHRFDSHLVGSLDYRAPQLIARALDEVAGDRRFEHLIDLGCGTGLMLEALSGRITRATGIDLSRAMLDQARAKGSYDRLLPAELVAAMRAEPAASADLVIAADVFCYCVDLVPAFEAAWQVLTPGGVFAFTIQTGNDSNVRIGADLRAHHAPDMLLEQARRFGFKERILRLESSRHDAGQPVQGATFVLEKPF